MVCFAEIEITRGEALIGFLFCVVSKCSYSNVCALLFFCRSLIIQKKWFSVSQPSSLLPSTAVPETSKHAMAYLAGYNKFNFFCHSAELDLFEKMSQRCVFVFIQIRICSFLSFEVFSQRSSSKLRLLPLWLNSFEFFPRNFHGCHRQRIIPKGDERRVESVASLI